MFEIEDILGLPVISEAFQRVDRQWPNLEQTRRRHEALRRVFGVMVEDVLSETGRNLNRTKPESLSDLQGLKMRIGGGIVKSVTEKFGITQMFKPAPQVYEMLTRGVADGGSRSRGPRAADAR